MDKKNTQGYKNNFFICSFFQNKIHWNTKLKTLQVNEQKSYFIIPFSLNPKAYVPVHGNYSRVNYLLKPKADSASFQHN